MTDQPRGGYGTGDCTLVDIAGNPAPAPVVPDTRPGPERIARMFHEAYERLAPSFAYETREASAMPWAEVPENNRRLMTAVVVEISDALVGEVATRALPAVLMQDSLLTPYGEAQARALREATAEVERLRERLEQFEGAAIEVDIALGPWLHGERVTPATLSDAMAHLMGYVENDEPAASRPGGMPAQEVQ